MRNRNDKQLIQFKQVSLSIQKETWPWTSRACFVKLHSTKNIQTQVSWSDCYNLLKVQGHVEGFYWFSVLEVQTTSELPPGYSRPWNWLVLYLLRSSLWGMHNSRGIIYGSIASCQTERMTGKWHSTPNKATHSTCTTFIYIKKHSSSRAPFVWKNLLKYPGAQHNG